jgi:hypothetical protein
MTTKISFYRNDLTGELGSPHQIGETEDGRPLYQAIEGWTPANEDGSTADVECDENGNWIPVSLDD